jgi:hypothetical protein
MRMRGVVRWTTPPLCALLLAGCSGQARPGASAGAHDAGVRLLPEPAVATAQLAAVVDARGADPSRCTYLWKRNGSVIAQPNSNVLDPDRFFRGDEITVEVTLPTTAGPEGTTLRAATRVANAPPVVRAVQVRADAAQGGAQLVATAECWDADHDATTSSYRWLRNGRVVEGETGAAISLLTFARGDRIEAEAVASDGRDASAPRRSEPFTIDNRAPQFSLLPPELTTQGDLLSVQASAVDPDGDPVKFELVNAPYGMTIDAQGAIHWSMPAREHRPDEVRVTVRASDGRQGQATQEFTVKLTQGAVANTR